MIALIAVVLVAPVFRVNGGGDLDTVGLGIQLAATALLVAILFRRVVLMTLERSEFSMWPWVLLGLFLSSAAAATGQEDSTAFNVVFGVVLFLALALVSLAVYAVVHRRRSG